MKRTNYLLLFLLCSCTSFINNFDEALFKDGRDVKLKENKDNFCKASSKHILLNDNKKSQNDFHSFISNSKLKLSFIDKAVLWSLVQMKIRPDLASPNAGLQIFINNKQIKVSYRHIFSKDANSYAYFYALEQLLKNNSRFSLKEHIKFIDTQYRYTLSVSQNFSNYLMSKKLELSKNSLFSKKYLRGDENLKQGERLRNYSLLNVYRLYKKNKAHYYTQSKLFKYQAKTGNVECNYNLKSYEKNIYSIHNQPIQGHTFGIKDGEDSFLAVSSIAHFGFDKQNSPNYFQGESLTKPAAFCILNNDLKLALFSNNSRDPAQHLFHAVNYGLNNVKSTSEIKDLINHSRYLVLENPKRIIFESNKSTEEHLQNLLKLDIPIYNSYSLGNVSGFYKEDSQSGIFIDSRSDSYLKCN